jgi:hypothetical protein
MVQAVLNIWDFGPICKIVDKFYHCEDGIIAISGSLDHKIKMLQLNNRSPPLNKISIYLICIYSLITKLFLKDLNT